MRAYTGRSLRRLLVGLPLEIVHHGRIFGGYDNIERRWPRFGRWLKQALYTAEKTPFVGTGKVVIA